MKVKRSELQKMGDAAYQEFMRVFGTRDDLEIEEDTMTCKIEHVKAAEKLIPLGDRYKYSGHTGQDAWVNNVQECMCGLVNMIDGLEVDVRELRALVWSYKRVLAEVCKVASIPGEENGA